jgi:hypothetical protein
MLIGRTGRWMKVELTRTQLGDGWSCGKTHRQSDDLENVNDKTLAFGTRPKGKEERSWERKGAEN